MTEQEAVEMTRAGVMSQMGAMVDVVAKYQQIIDAVNAEAEAKRQQIIDENKPRVDGAVMERDMAMDAVHKLVEEHRAILFEGKSKTIHLSNGEVSLRLTPEALVIEDADGLEQKLRRLGLWAKFSVRQPRKLDRAKLKKARDLVGQLADDLVHFEQKESLIVKVPKLKLEVKKDLSPLKRWITRSDT